MWLDLVLLVECLPCGRVGAFSAVGQIRMNILVEIADDSSRGLGQGGLGLCLRHEATWPPAREDRLLMLSSGLLVDTAFGVIAQHKGMHLLCCVLQVVVEALAAGLGWRRLVRDLWGRVSRCRHHLNL